MTAGQAAPVSAVTVTIVDDIATLTVGAGERFNAMGRAEWQDLRRAALSLAQESSLKAVVVRGYGGRFSSGSDLREWADLSGSEVSMSFTDIELALQAVENLSVPTVAVVQGVAAGAGCQLALACDIQLMDDSARVGMPTSQLGVLVPASFANRLSLRIGSSRTKDLLYGGRLLSAVQAERMGLVTTVVVGVEVDDALKDLLHRWSGNSAASLRAAKAAVNLGLAPVTEPVRQLGVGEVVDPQEFSQRVNSFLRRKSQGSHKDLS